MEVQIPAEKGLGWGSRHCRVVDHLSAYSDRKPVTVTGPRL